EIRSSSQPRHAFEMALVKWIHLRQLTPIADVIASLGGEGRPMPRPAAPPAPLRPAPTPMARSTAAAPPAGRPASPAPPTPAAGPRPSAPAPAPAVAADPAAVKSAVLASIRESNKVFYGMVIAQAQKIEVEGDSLVFTFAPVHKTLRTRLEEKRGWIEQLAQSASGRKLTLATREGPPIAAASSDDGSDAKKAELKARAKAEPSVQAVLDVFGGEIEDVEEIK
ncbi:MAG TPA: hypothetical protein VFO19_08835, partial [Vicinamibacterales bacterium]|nr:hypothetical protein [Vicinamibacterales bacterium]